MKYYIVCSYFVKNDHIRPFIAGEYDNKKEAENGFYEVIFNGEKIYGEKTTIYRAIACDRELIRAVCGAEDFDCLYIWMCDKNQFEKYFGNQSLPVKKDEFQNYIVERVTSTGSIASVHGPFQCKSSAEHYAHGKNDSENYNYCIVKFTEFVDRYIELENKFG